MIEKKNVVYDPEAMDPPVLRFLIGEAPNPEPDGQENSHQHIFVNNTGKKSTVKRIIAHLEEDF